MWIPFGFVQVKKREPGALASATSVNRPQFPHQRKQVSCVSGKQRSEPDPEREQGTEVQVQLVVFKNETYLLSVDRTKMSM